MSGFICINNTKTLTIYNLYSLDKCVISTIALQEYNFHPKNWKIDIHMRYIL